MKSFENINTLKYLDNNGKYKVKTPKDKTFKTYDYVIKKDSLHNLRNKQEKNKKDEKIQLQKNIELLKKSFIKGSKKDTIVQNIIRNIDHIENINTEIKYTGQIQPTDVIYSNRHIKT